MQAAYSRGHPVTLRSPPGAAQYAGLAFLNSLFDGAAKTCPEAKHSVILDCGADGALAHRAMAMGFRRIAFSGPRAMRDKLIGIAAKCGAQLAPARTPKGALDLLDSPDLAGALAAYLERRVTAKSGKNRALPDKN